MKRISKFIPLVIVLLIFSFTISGLISRSIGINDGHLVYALDDVYIHMAIAKNLVSTGTWGVFPNQYSSASSSILWPALIAVLFRLFGIFDTLPLILNIISALVGIFYFYRIAQFFDLPKVFCGLILFPVIFLAPMPALVLTGMEHITHLTITLAVIYYALKIIETEKVEKSYPIILVFLILILSSIRYEGIFLGVFLTIFLIVKRRYKLSLLTGLTSFTPMLMIGIVSMHHGWHFLPNPILLKAEVSAGGFSSDFLSRTLDQGLQRLVEEGDFQWLLVFSVGFLCFYLFSKNHRYVKIAWLHLLFLGMLVPHILWSGFGWFYRYEMYLIGTGIYIDLVTIGCLVWYNQSIRLLHGITRIIFYLILILLGYSTFAYRFKANQEVVTATANIYQQQYQMARFLDEKYANNKVAVNDIGAVAFYSHADLIDLWGLANLEVSREKIQNTYTTASIRKLTEQADVQIAIIYDSWFVNEKSTPGYWIKVGQWTIKNNVVCGDDTISFYAVNPLEKNTLIKNLNDFSSKIPAEIIQRGDFISKQY